MFYIDTLWFVLKLINMRWLENRYRAVVLVYLLVLTVRKEKLKRKHLKISILYRFWAVKTEILNWSWCRNQKYILMWIKSTWIVLNCGMFWNMHRKLDIIGGFHEKLVNTCNNSQNLFRIWKAANISCICKTNTANHLKFWSAVVRINTEGKSLIMKSMVAFTHWCSYNV